MSRRNLILLIIVLAAVVISVFGFLYFRQVPTVPREETAGTNFISQFNPFGSSTPRPPAVTPPVDVSEPEPAPAETPKVKLMKVSSMPVAGFAVYLKERLKDMPIVVPATIQNTAYNFGTTTLKDGSSGEGVMEIQRFLNNTYGFDLELDGVFDATITVAIKQWQSDKGLVADGIVGTKTKAKMYASVNQNTQTSTPTSPPTEFVPALRYVEKTTGNIFQTFADKIEERKFSVTTIPKVYDAYFGNFGQSVVMRYLKTNDRTIETFVGNLPKEFLGADSTSDNKVKGTFLPDNVKDISLSPDALKMFYLFNSGDNIVGTTLSFLDNKKIQMFDSPFTEWLSSWPKSSMITLSTKPSANVPGYMYVIDLNNKNVIKVLGDINGLTTLASPDGKLILYGNNNLSLGIHHTDTRNSDILTLATLPEKCVWGKNSDVIYCAVPKSISAGEYPDSWYQGEVSFSDQLWKMDVITGNATFILDPATVTGGEDIDGIKLALDDRENYLFFVNKKDSFLWKLDLK